MTDYSNRSLLPGAPPPGSARTPSGAHAIDIACSRAFNLDAQVLIDVTDPDTCPAVVLPFLAWAYSVDEWPPGATDADKRNIIKAAVSTHRIKGTRKSIEDVLAAAGYGAAEIEEGVDAITYDRSRQFDGTWKYGNAGSWAHWAVTIENSDPVPSAELISLLTQTAPARCRLISVGHQKLFFRYDGTFQYAATRKYERTYEEAA